MMYFVCLSLTFQSLFQVFNSLHSNTHTLNLGICDCGGMFPGRKCWQGDDHSIPPQQVSLLFQFLHFSPRTRRTMLSQLRKWFMMLLFTAATRQQISHWSQTAQRSFLQTLVIETCVWFWYHRLLIFSKSVQSACGTFNLKVPLKNLNSTYLNSAASAVSYKDIWGV